MCNLLGQAMAIVRPEMKSYIWLQTTDGSIQEVEEEVAMFCPVICQEVVKTGMGSSKNYAIKLPRKVNPAILGLILEYCRFHQSPGHSNKELKTFDENFIRLDTTSLCELISAADSLKLKPLVDLTSRAIARIIESKTPEEIRETFNIPDDLTEEEKLGPLRNVTKDTRIRLLNRLYARKRKALKEREKVKNVEVAEELTDKRSVDDLLSFINGGDGDSKCVSTAKNKKKNRRRKDQPKNTTSNNENKNREKEIGSLISECHDGELQDVSGSSQASMLQLLSNLDFNDADIDDGLDPELKEEIDREVEEFARRLNSGWQERRQEILSSGQERRLLPTSKHGYSSVARDTETGEGKRQGGELNKEAEK